MSNPDLDAISLVDRYKRLRRRAMAAMVENRSSAHLENSMDAIYARIAGNPAASIADMLDKLWFAHHCLTEEDDIKEAINLILQVCLAIEADYPESGDTTRTA